MSLANYPGNTFNFYRQNISPSVTRALRNIPSLRSSCTRKRYKVVVLA